jgi:cob(I)alamin adenosyltransferase
MNYKVHLYTGEGGCKTTSALGLALRAIGHGQKVIFIQFMKGRKSIGEYKAQKKVPGLKIYQCGRPGFVNLKNPSEQDKKLAQKGLELAKKVAKQKPDILVLDEVNLAVAVGLLKEKDVVSFVKSVPKKTFVVLTGRRATKGLKAVSDIVTEVKDTKRPKRMAARKGIEY